jgi:hypothetical protein
MKLTIVRRNENILNDEVVSVQVHYKLAGEDNKRMSNGFIETTKVDASIEELKQIVIDDLKEQAEELDAE